MFQNTCDSVDLKHCGRICFRHTAEDFFLLKYRSTSAGRNSALGNLYHPSHVFAKEYLDCQFQWEIRFQHEQNDPLRLTGVHARIFCIRAQSILVR